MVDAPSVPYTSFSDFPISPAVKEALAAMGYAAPTEVQSHVVEPGVQGRDLLVQSKTGSGKTTAFGIPLMERLQAGQAKPGQPQALVLLPTRELAHQVAAELTLLGKTQGITVLPIYGGVPIGKQVSVLEDGVDIIVGTPGRLLDHIRRGNLKLSQLKMVVLDEADEMLSMGFWDDVTEMIRLSPKDRQTLLFSATLPYEVARSAAHLMGDVVRLDLSGDDLSVSGIDNCILHVLPGVSKPRQLLYLLEGESAQSAIIFCNTRAETDMLAKYLTQSGFVAEPLSGDFKQKERDKTMARIKSGELRYMVATDIAARGIDINDLSHVFNYALPEFCEVYLHRVGRTGRIGKIGKAISLVDGKGLGTLSVLEREFGVKFIEMTLPPEAEVIRARSQRIMKELAEKAAVAELGQHLNVAQDILAHAEAPQVVAYLLKAYFNGQAGGDSRQRATAPVAAAVAGGAVEALNAESSAPAAQSPEPSAQSQDAAAQGEEAAPSRSRRRRRGRGRQEGEGQEGDAPKDAAAEAAPSAQPPREAAAPKNAPKDAPTEDDVGMPTRAASQGPDRFEIIDAVDLLFPERRQQRAQQAEAAAAAKAPRSPRPERGQGGRQRGPERGNDRGPERGNGRGPERGNERGNDRGNRNTDRSGRPDRQGQPYKAAAAAPPFGHADEPLAPGMSRIRVNIGFDDGFKGRGSVAKKISALAGLNEGTLTELESRRDHAVLRASTEIAEMVLDRVDGAPLGKKIISVQIA